MSERAEKAERILSRSHRTNKARDAAERRVGFAAPGDGPLDALLRTAMDAITCGVATEDWSCAAEGWDMLRLLHLRMTGNNYPDGVEKKTSSNNVGAAGVTGAKSKPTHRTIMYLPNKDQPVIVAEIAPTGKAKNTKGYCKYCYRTHRSWWEMPPEEYEGRALLCGYCEHVSLAEFVVSE